MDSVRPTRHVLLTGAGFSANWGGKVAGELWDDIYSDEAVLSHNDLRNRLRNTASFEDALADVYNRDQSDAERRAVEIAIQNSFVRMDSDFFNIGLRGDNTPHGGQFCRDFLSRMCRDSNKKGRQTFLFTLNQDLLLERMWIDHISPTHHPPVHPGVPHMRMTHFSGHSRNIGYFTPNIPPYTEQWDETPLPFLSTISDDFERKIHPVNYVKLHGSFNWRRESGNHEMVIGTEKTRQINASPLLDWYSEIFRAVLNADVQVRLLIIGYSFWDAHINEAIAKSVRDKGTLLYVIDTGFESLRQRFTSEPPQIPGCTRSEAQYMFQMIRFTSRIPLVRMIDSRGTKSADFDNLCQRFFD